MPTTRMKFVTEGLPGAGCVWDPHGRGQQVWKPGEREIFGEVEKGLGVVFFYFSPSIYVKEQ